MTCRELFLRPLDPPQQNFQENATEVGSLIISDLNIPTRNMHVKVCVFGYKRQLGMEEKVNYGGPEY